jgi:hypothetical protein
MTGRGYSIFDTGIGRCGIAWSPAGIIGVQLPEVREIDTRRLLSIEGSGRMPGKTLFDVLLPVAPPRAHS